MVSSYNSPLRSKIGFLGVPKFCSRSSFKGLICRKEHQNVFLKKVIPWKITSLDTSSNITYNSLALMVPH